MSTSWLLLNYFFIGFIIQLFTTLLCISTSMDFKRLIMDGDSFGIWFNYMFKYCYFNRATKIKFCCFPYMIPKIAYPFVFFGVVCLLDIFSFKLRVDVIVGILIALFECEVIIPRAANSNCC